MGWFEALSLHIYPFVKFLFVVLGGMHSGEAKVTVSRVREGGGLSDIAYSIVYDFGSLLVRACAGSPLILWLRLVGKVKACDLLHKEKPHLSK